MNKPIYLSVFLVFLIIVNSLAAQNTSTIAEIYNYDVGDIFHTRFYEEIDGYEWEKIYSRTVIDKYYSADQDTVFYTTDVIKMERESYPPEWEWSYYEHTGFITNLDSLINNGNIDTVFTDESLYNGREINYLEVDNYPNTYNEWRYVKGCGRAYYYYNSYGAGISFTELVYYNKSGEEWGEPLLILGQEEINEHSDITIYPNPARNTLNINAGDRQFESLTLFTTNGTQLSTQAVHSASFSMDIAELSPGIYFIRLESKKQTITEVFVKE